LQVKLPQAQKKSRLTFAVAESNPDCWITKQWLSRLSQLAQAINFVLLQDYYF
jgi:hypothetical protein